MQKKFIIKYNDKEYPVVYTVKNMKNIVYRYKDGVFDVHGPYYVSDKRIIEGLNKFAGKLITKEERMNKAVQDDKIYLFGYELPFNPNGGEIKFADGSKLSYIDKEDLLDRIQVVYKDVMTSRTRYYENLMGINPPYKVKIKNMSSRYGSNSSRTHSISYADNLYPFSIDILDSLVVHELAHHFYRDHSKNFYNLVLKYCPNYLKINKKLKEKIFR